MEQKIAEVDKKVVTKVKQANKKDSPTVEKPFDKVPTPIETVDRIVESPDGKGYQLLPEEEKRKIDTAKKFEQLRLLPFSDNEDDELSLETIASQKLKGLNKSQKSTTKPKEAQRNNLMQRTATKTAKEDERTPFHQDAFEAAGGVETPAVKGSNAGGWTVAGGKRMNICTQLMSPKGIANLMRLCNPTPPQSNSDSGTLSSNENRFAVLQDNDEDSDATTDFVPTDGIEEGIQQGAVYHSSNIQEQVVEPDVEGGNVPHKNDRQPDGVVSSKEADFHKAKSE